MIDWGKAVLDVKAEVIEADQALAAMAEAIGVAIMALGNVIMDVKVGELSEPTQLSIVHADNVLKSVQARHDYRAEFRP